MANFSSDDPAVGYSERDHSADIEQGKTQAQEGAVVEFGSGWYHDTAIIEAEQARPRTAPVSR